MTKIGRNSLDTSKKVCVAVFQGVIWDACDPRHAMSSYARQSAFTASIKLQKSAEIPFIKNNFIQFIYKEKSRIVTKLKLKI